jgi:7,8-dihydropterin-6-yl-methyl-4-(beta-D-ribofuranosyl)aminobenzene 5'-phosphate synthase
MINVIKHAREVMNTEKVYMVLGGTHLSPASSEQLRKTITALKEMDVSWLGASHCTGLPAAAELSTQLNGRFFFNTAGREIVFPFGIDNESYQ